MSDDIRYYQRDGHRGFVGGKWQQIGQLQFDFLKSQGMRPAHVVLDIACGSLRAGVWLIPYLASGHYLGLEAEPELLAEGIAAELSPTLQEEKAPEFVISRDFAFDRFSRQPDLAIANSLFTHLNRADIKTCLANLAAFTAPGFRCFATFFESTKMRANPDLSHPQLGFAYTRSEMEDMGAAAGFKPQYMGDWGHPREQMMMCYQR